MACTRCQLFYFYRNIFGTMTDEYYMQQALHEATKAEAMGEVPIGAVVVWGERIVSRGHNQVELLQDATAHAEMIALTAAFGELGKYLPEATLYVTLEPCLMCCGALHWSKIGRVVYGASDEKNGFRKYLKADAAGNLIHAFHPKTTVSFGVLAEECAALVTGFFKARR